MTRPGYSARPPVNQQSAFSLTHLVAHHHAGQDRLCRQKGENHTVATIRTTINAPCGIAATLPFSSLSKKKNAHSAIC